MRTLQPAEELAKALMKRDGLAPSLPEPQAAGTDLASTFGSFSLKEAGLQDEKSIFKAADRQNQVDTQEMEAGPLRV